MKREKIESGDQLIIKMKNETVDAILVGGFAAVLYRAEIHLKGSLGVPKANRDSI